jgi:hypothetical protein
MDIVMTGTATFLNLSSTSPFGEVVEMTTIAFPVASAATADCIADHEECAGSYVDGQLVIAGQGTIVRGQAKDVSALSGEGGCRRQ